MTLASAPESRMNCKGLPAFGPSTWTQIKPERSLNGSSATAAQRAEVTCHDNSIKLSNVRMRVYMQATVFFTSGRWPGFHVLVNQSTGQTHQNGVKKATKNLCTLRI